MSGLFGRPGDNDREHPRQPMWRRYTRFYRDDPVADLDDELRDHLESTTEALVAGGMTREAAHDEALRRFGQVANVRREVQQLDGQHMKQSGWMDALESFVQDMRYALRVFVRSPGFTVVAAVSIGVAVAANSTVFSVVNAALLRPIPGTHTDRLVRVYVNHHSPFSWQNLTWFRDRTKTLDQIIGERYGAMSFRADAADRTERVRTSLVTNGFFSALGVRMALGRYFSGDEKSAESAEPLAVLTWHFWQRRFGGDSSVIGRVVSIASHPVMVVGVTEPDFRSSVVGWSPELFLPLAAAPALTGKSLEDFGGSLYTTARLAPGANINEGNAELSVLMSQLARTDSARYERMTVRLDHVRGINAEARAVAAAASAFLMGMVGLVLLIACANVANLLLGRAAARQTEIGVRLALGAGRKRIIRQLLTESLVLSALGAVLGLVATFALTRGLAAVIPAAAGIDNTFFAPDHRVLLFTAFMCLGTTLLFGLVPALRAASPHLVPMIKSDAQQTGNRRQRGGLVGVQAALCVLLLAIASLFWRSLQSMRGLDSGFNSAEVVNVALDLSLIGSNRDQESATFTRVLDRAKAIPGVRSAALAALVPLTGNNMETRIVPEGMTGNSRFDFPMTYFNVVSPHYFETLQIPLQSGRDFLDVDAANTPRVAIVNETAAKRWWPNDNAVGKHFKWGGLNGADVEVIGVARDTDYNMAGEDRKGFVYLPFAQEHRTEMVLQLKTSSGLSATREAVWRIVNTDAPTLPPPSVSTMNDDMLTTQMPVLAGAALLGALGCVALLLAATGIYGVTAYAVARRTREIGIRAALGAGRGRLLSMVVRESLRPVSKGIVVGLLLAVLAAFGLSRVLFGIRTFDPVVLPGVAMLLVLVAVAASVLPAIRAASVDPVRAIRSE